MYLCADAPESTGELYSTVIAPIDIQVVWQTKSNLHIQEDAQRLAPQFKGKKYEPL